MKVTVDELDVFKCCGPTHLLERKNPWSNEEDCERAVMACLVQAVYALDKDRSVKKMNLPPLAPDWYLSFNCNLVRVLHETDALQEEEEESEQSKGRKGNMMQEILGLIRPRPPLEQDNEKSVVGAIFKWSRRLSMSLMRPSSAPKIVIAFRGTIPFGDTLSKDVAANLDVVMLQLHHNRRYKVAYKAVQEVITRYGDSHVCIAGHSLGAALCLPIGQTLAHQHNVVLRTHLFNPPFPSIFIQRKLKILGIGHDHKNSGGDSDDGNNNDNDDGINDNNYLSATKQGKENVVINGEDKDQDNNKSDHSLYHWCPNIYINPNDPICKGYISYFREVHGTHSKSTIRKFWQSLRGLEVKPFHLIPSAQLHCVNPSNGETFLKAHGMKQWWSQETHIQKQKLTSIF